MNALLQLSLLGKGKQTLKEKSITPIDFTTCATTVLRKNIERYDMLPSPMFINLYVSTINNFKLDNNVRLLDISRPYKARVFHERNCPFYFAEKAIRVFWFFFTAGLRFLWIKS